jgi:redox-sensitive bicupin YhaK (pirin superfamily)
MLDAGCSMLDARRWTLRESTMLKQVLLVRRNVRPHWVGDGFPVRSLFSYRDDQAVFDPFLLLDYAAPYEFPPSGARRGVGEHPHRGFETVTIVYHGELAHGDSAGNRGTIGPGDVQWMTAAAGVVHEEFHSDAFTARGGTFEVFQLWVNLPAREKMARPRYQEIRDADIPRVALGDGAGSVRVIAGEFGGTRGPATTVTRLNVWDIRIAAGKSVEFAIDNGLNALVAVRRGVATVNNEQTAGATELCVFGRDGDRIHITAGGDENVEALLLSGEAIGEPVVGEGPFVMNTAAVIRQAITDYQGGRMGSLT